MTDPAARAPRVTYDVDVIAVVSMLGAHQEFQTAMRERGFSEATDSSVMFRWHHRATGLVLDAVPSLERLAGVSDPWLELAAEAAEPVTLPSGRSVRAVPPWWLVVLKLQAFADRGADDCLASRDFEDLVLLIDGREELSDELGRLPDGAARFVAGQLERLMGLPTFDYGLEGALGGDGQARAAAVTAPRWRGLIGK